MEMLVLPIYLLNPYFALVIAGIGFAANPRNWKKWLFLYVSFIFIAGFCTNTLFENDLDRYYLTLDFCKGLTLVGVIQRLNDGLIVENFFYWLYSHLGVYQLMPAVSSACVFGISTYIACDYAERTSQYRALYIVLLFQFLMIPLFNVATNVRNIWAFSLITLAIYKDLVQHRRNIMTILLYVAPCFLHMTGIVIIFCRIVVPIIKRFPLILTVLIGTLSSLISFAYSRISYITIGGVFGLVLRKLINKSNIYLERVDTFSNTVVNSRFEILTRPVMMLSAIIIGYFSYCSIRKKENPYYDFAAYCFAVSIIVLASSVFAIPAYWRFGSVMVIAFSGELLRLWSSRKQLSLLNQILLYLLALLTFARFALLIPYLHARMDFVKFFTDVLLTNVYTVLIKIVSALSKL